MALNIQSGQTWAEIRAKINQDSLDMESNLKKYSESLFEFSQGTSNTVDFGSATIKNDFHNDYLGYINEDNVVYTGSDGGSFVDGCLKNEVTFLEMPLTSGYIKPRITIQKVDPVAMRGNGSSWDEKSFHKDSVNLELSVKLSIKTENSTFVFWEENNINIIEARENPNSIYNSEQIVEVDTPLFVTQDGEISFIAEVTYHKTINCNSLYKYKFYSGSFNVSLVGGINNPILNTTANNLGVW